MSDLLIIDGWYAAGKSTVWGLLDQTEEVFVSPVHEFSFGAFFEPAMSSTWMEQQHTGLYRKLLSKTEYYKIEQYSNEGEFPVSIGKGVSVDIPFKFDFYGFDREYMARVGKLDQWSESSLVKELYSSMNQFMGNEIRKNCPRYHATMGVPKYIDSYGSLREVFPNSKAIFVLRDVRDIIASRSTRKKRKIDLTDKNFFQISTSDLIRESEVEACMDFERKVKKLQSKYPEEVLVLRFDDIIYSTSAVCEEISEFLGLKKKLQPKCSCLGVELKVGDVSLLGETNDKAEELIGAWDMMKIRFHLILAKLTRIPFNVLSPKAYLKFSIAKARARLIKI